jgi:hypothetical protein
VVLVVLSLLATGACNGGGDDEDDPGAATPSGAALEDDDDKAQAANFRLSDFPPGWERRPAPLNPPDDADDRRFSECMGRPPAVELRTALADSDNFSTGELTRANSSAQVMRTEAIAREDIASLRGEKAIPCLSERLRAELAGQSPPGGPPFALRSLDRLEYPTVADDTVAFRVTVDAPSVRSGATLYVDQVFVRKGRMEVSFAFVDLERPFPSELGETLVRKLAERASAN